MSERISKRKSRRAILLEDSMFVFFEGVCSIGSLLKIVGGKMVYADGPFSKLGEAP